jgi:uncharacterized BrkB/YihY/UPF0761 family membrane protein
MKAERGSKGLLIFIVVALIVMAVWQIYSHIFIPKEYIETVLAYNIDKIMHLIGGMFVASLLVYIFGPQKFLSLIIAVLVVSIFWELFELYFDTQVTYYFSHDKYGWVLDTVGDTLFALFGTVAATRFIKTK